MKIQRIWAIISMFLLAACGGGGASNGAAPTVIKGVASKGIIIGGTAKVFALKADGSKDKELGQDITKADGSYSINIGSYTGPVTVEVSGDYTDEATGQPKTVPATAPLRAAHGNASGTVTVAVTPLTDLAVRQAGALTAPNIAASNNRISDAFKVDIIATVPVAPTAAVFQSSQTTQAQKDYTLALAAVSQQMAGGDSLEKTLTTLNSGISSTGMDAQTAAAITTAVKTFIENNPKNDTGVKSIQETSLQTVGSTSAKLTIALQGAAASSVKGIQANIMFPFGVVLRADPAGAPLADVLSATGSAAGSGYLNGKYTPPGFAPASLNLGFMTTGNLAAGDIITINADLASGTTTVPLTSAFIISGVKLLDSNGNAVSGVSLSIR